MLFLANSCRFVNVVIHVVKVKKVRMESLAEDVHNYDQASSQRQFKNRSLEKLNSIRCI